jgi:GTP-binding protein HflX
VRTRISRLKDDLSHIERTRRTQRKGRGSAFTIALVGYTNAGKSTLFNALTRGGAMAVDKLFATLDAKSQRASFEMPRQTVIIDTVGFIRKLPHHLVASFRSTMEEAVSADLVLHVIDASHPQAEEQREIGNQVMADLGIDPDRVIEVYNKIDEEAEERRPRPSGRGKARVVDVSALRGDGIDRLVEALRERERQSGEVLRLEIPHQESRLIALLHELGEIREQVADDRTTFFCVWLPHDAVHLFQSFAAAGPILKAVNVG